MYAVAALNTLPVRLMACSERGVFLWILKHRVDTDQGIVLSDR